MTPVPSVPPVPSPAVRVRQTIPTPPRPFPGRPVARRAFTLPEVLFAMLLLTIGLSSIMLLFPIAARMQASAVNDTAGRAFAESALAALQAQANSLPAAALATDSNIAAIPSNTIGFPTILPPTGNYQYRACSWKTANGHFNAGVFAFNPATNGNGEVTTLTGTITSSPTGPAGLTTINASSSLTNFSADQMVLVQDTTISGSPVYIAHVVNATSSNVISIGPALPNVANNDNVTVVYLPQRAVAVVAGSIR